MRRPDSKSKESLGGVLGSDYTYSYLIWAICKERTILRRFYGQIPFAHYPLRMLDAVRPSSLAFL
jgi:hypothetical protein